VDEDEKKRQRHRRGELSWNFMPNEPVKVMAFTNCAKIEFFLNGTSLGWVETDKYVAAYEIPFAKGELKAVGYASGEMVVSTLTTYGAPTALKMTAVEPELTANGQDVAHIEIEVIDGDGQLSANACPEIRVSIEGGELLGLENGYLMDNTPYSQNSRRAHHGRLLAYVRAPKEAGEIVVTAQSRGLKACVAKIKAV